MTNDVADAVCEINVSSSNSLIKVEVMCTNRLRARAKHRPS